MVKELLYQEDQRECQERDIDMRTLLDDRSQNVLGNELTSSPKNKKKKGKEKGEILFATDIRQRRRSSAASNPPAVNNSSAANSPSVVSSSPATNSIRGSPAPNPWARFTSFSIRLATLIPPCSVARFQSAFHDPQHSSPGEAVRHTLQKVNDTLDHNNDKLSEQEARRLFDTLLKSPIYETTDAGQQGQLLSDVRLALRVTEGKHDIASELVSILFDLDHGLDAGIYHSRPTTPISPMLLPSTSLHKARPSESQRVRSGSTLTPPISPALDDNDLDGNWIHVPERSKNGPQSLTPLIPAYDQNLKAGIRGVGDRFGEGGKRYITEPSRKQIVAQLYEERKQILDEATKHWKRGNARNKGGDIALCLAETVSYRVLFLMMRL